MPENERLHVLLVPKSSEALARTVESEGVSKTDIVNRALLMYAYLTEQQNAGGEVLVRHGDMAPVSVRFF